MQAGYFQTAWNDIKHSDGWFKKFALLALLQFVPVFGQIVLLGYLYGWARDIAWNIHAPLPERLLGNEDGKLYSRGFFLVIISLVFALVPSIVSSFADSLSDAAPGAFLLGLALFLSLASLALALFCSVLSWVGSMRTAIYGRLGPGFQLKQIWKMIGHDTNGIMRILGMNLLIGFLLVLVFSFVIAIVLAVAGAGAFAALAAPGHNPMAMSEVDILATLLPALGAGGAVLLVVGYFMIVGLVWLEALVARALGYWTRQFNVPAWGGQDDPLPFESGQAARQAQQAQYAAQVEYAQAQAQAAQMHGQQVSYQDQQARQQYAQAQAGVQMQQGGQTQPSAQPDWIAQANAMAPAEQRDPFASGRPFDQQAGQQAGSADDPAQYPAKEE